MRRHMQVLLAGTCSLVSLGAAAGVVGANRNADSRVTVPVEVNVTCTGGSVQVTVNPWVVRLQQGDDIDWILNDQAQSSTIEIAPKQPGQWAFGIERHQGQRGAGSAARARNMRPNQRGRRYQYDITLICQDGNTSYTVVIDPDVEIEE